MRVNVYAEEITDRVEIVTKGERTGLSFHLELPVTVEGKHIRGPFLHGPDVDDSSAVIFWGRKEDLRKLLEKALSRLNHPATP